LGSDKVEIVGGADRIVTRKDALALLAGEAESVTWIITLSLATVSVGVPLIWPVLLVRVKPEGKEPAVTCQV
jgi:hypothetical protein